MGFEFGWEAALSALHGLQRPAKAPETTVCAGFWRSSRLKADLNPETLRGYAIAFRTIVADIYKINGGKEKFDYRGGGHARWLVEIHAIKLADVTPERVQALEAHLYRPSR